MTERLTSQVEAGGFCHLDLRVQVPVATVSATYTRVLQNLRREVQVAGYRVGKAPLSAVRRLVGHQLSQLVAAQLIKDNADKAARAQGLPPVGPRPEAYCDAALEGQAFEFRVRLNIRAEVTELDPSYNSLELVMPPPLGDLDMLADRQLQLFLSRCAESRARSEAERVEAGDRVTFSCTVIDDQQPQPQEFKQGQTQTRIIGVEEELPGKIERSLLSLRADETRRISRIIKHRDGWDNPPWEGLKVTFDLKVHRVEQLLLPELNDELVQRETDDVPSVEALRHKLRQELVDKETATCSRWLEAQVENKLLARSEVEIPQLLLDRVAESIYRSRKLDSSTEAQQQNALRQECLEQAQEIISSTAVLAEVARRERLVVRSEANSGPSNQYHDLRRVVTRHLISQSNLQHEADVDDEEENAARDEDSARLHTRQNLLNKRSELKKLADYKGIPITVPAPTAHVKATESRLEELRHEHAAYRVLDTPFTPGPAQSIVVTRFVTIGDDLVPNMTLLRSALAIPPSDAELPPHLQVYVGMRAGENKKVLCPELLPAAAEKGLKVEIATILHEVHTLTLPTLDDRFAQEFLDVDSLAALRAQLAQEVEQNQRQARQSLAGKLIFDQLTAASEFQLDTETLEKSVITVLDSDVLREHFDIEENTDQEVAAARVRDIITKITQCYLITAEIARRENITHDDESEHEDERLFAKVEKFLLKEAKIVDDTS